MEEIKIIKAQLNKLEKKGISLDIVNDTICFVSNKMQIKTIDDYDKSTKKWDGMAKDIQNYDIVDTSKYIIDVLT